MVLQLSHLKLFACIKQAFCDAVSTRSSVLATVTMAALIKYLTGGLLTVAEG